MTTSTRTDALADEASEATARIIIAALIAGKRPEKRRRILHKLQAVGCRLQRQAIDYSNVYPIRGAVRGETVNAIDKAKDVAAQAAQSIQRAAGLLLENEADRRLENP